MYFIQILNNYIHFSNKYFYKMPNTFVHSKRWQVLTVCQVMPKELLMGTMMQLRQMLKIFLPVA